ncbi:hypothetical protein Nisw_01940 [Candidatus Nitrosopumilus sp. SW]|uniref:hypothetical protein n=1 Tax=Candidatus Nitrosopumilus sp. SW TaxID=2508726 RepID=UPI0011504B64|nr:hypothetical protein [Candidatus Nitrosopumilus sp. SW]QDI88380.1 hypothetical protein Nisw_01940 [Candidatus Nitrosopumilus sp. SW]
MSIFFTIFFNSVYAQTPEDQITLSGDLQNNPVAQDILKKIEQSKKWIAQIEQRNFENSKRQLELEQKRAEVLQSLEDDLRKWEELWSYYTFDNVLERALENSPAKDTSSIYDHPLKFTASKIDAGREALQKIILEGGSPEQARDAFTKAAKITRAEMLSVNALYNVLNNNAYYNQQVLFESDGKFNYELSGEELRKYYQDFRTNPEYLDANPFDVTSWEDLSKTNPSTECRPGHVLVYRNHADDYVCTTEYTAEMWMRHNMGKIVDSSYEEPNPVITEQKFNKDRILQKVSNLNSKIESMQAHYEEQLLEIIKKYDSLLADIKSDKYVEERRILENPLKSNYDSKKIMSQQIMDIREKFNDLEKNTLVEKDEVLKILENQHILSVEEFIDIYKSDDEIAIEWNYSYPIFYSPAYNFPQSESSSIIKTSFDDDLFGLVVDDTSLKNAFGKKIHSLKLGQLIQIASDITNHDDTSKKFVYLVEIRDEQNQIVQPLKWITGQLDSNQTLNLGLSWIPKNTGNFYADVFLGPNLDFVSHTETILISVVSPDQLS